METNLAIINRIYQGENCFEERESRELNERRRNVLIFWYFVEETRAFSRAIVKLEFYRDPPRKNDETSDLSDKLAIRYSSNVTELEIPTSFPAITIKVTRIAQIPLETS